MMIKKYILPVILVALAGSAQSEESFLLTDFANEIDAELGEVKSAAAPQAPTSNPEMEGWTVDGFLKSINRAGSKAGSPVAVPVEDIIREAAKRSARQAQKSPYLDAVSEEAGDLSVNAIDTKNVKGLIRNIPSISRIEYSENMLEIGGRVIRDGYITVREGDSLSLIAVQVYGDAQRYDRIFEANQNLLTDPDVVTVGIKLFIPIQ